MTHQAAELAGERQPLYQKTWWRSGFNAVWVLISLGLVVLILAVSAAVTGGHALDGRNLQNLGWSWLAHVIILPPVILIIASGGLDLSVAAIIGFSSVLVAQAAASGNLLAGAVGGFVMALVIGLVNGLLAGGTRIPGALVTLAIATLLRGVTLSMSQGQTIIVRKLDWLTSPVLPWLMLILSIAFGVVWSILVHRHKAAQPPGVEFSSWATRLLFVGLPYVVASLMAGFVGLMYVGRLQAGISTAGTGIEVDEILIALLGGVPLSSLLIANGVLNIVGGLVAALGLVIFQNMINLAALPVTTSQVTNGALTAGTALVSYLYYLVVGKLPFGGQKQG